MTEKIKVVGLGGSLSASSSSLTALKIALEGAAEGGARTEIFDLRELNLPMYAPDADAPESVRKLCEAVYQADGLLWSSPLYHGTISGVFKNALDWLELLGTRRPAYLTDKVVGLISTAGGTQGLQAINTMEFIVRALRGWSVPLVIPIPQAWRVFDEGKTSDPKIAEQLRSLGREVTRAARQFSKAGIITTPDAEQVAARVQPISETEVASA